MQDSIFTKIIKGQIPSYKIYEDGKTIAILDIHPVQPGHTLVIPKIQIDHFEDLPDDYYLAMWQTVKVVSKRLSVLGRKRIHISVVGTDVPHAHVHLIPFDKTKDFKKEVDMDSDPNISELQKIADKLKIKGEK
jgi:histidine triad (HIT) family protein